MLPQSHLATVARNVTWTGPGFCATEPHEVGWAREAVFFVRALKPPSWQAGSAVAHVQISPDGMNWVNHDATVTLPETADEMTHVAVRHFGGWLRLAATMTPGDEITLLVSLHLKA